MKKFYLLLLILLSFTSQIIPQELEIKRYENSELPYLYEFKLSNGSDSLLLTRTRQIWNTNSSNWLNDSLIEYSYNNENLVDTLTEHKWRNTVWGNDRRITFQYDIDNKLIEQAVAFWYTTHWSVYGQTFYLYNNGNLWRVDLYLTGNYIARQTYQWNSINLVTEIVNEHRDEIYGFWCYGYKYEYTYGSNDKVSEIIGYDGDNCFLWLIDVNKLYTYDEYDNMVEYIMQVWNSPDSSWTNYSLHRYEYDNDNLLVLDTYLSWDANLLDWKNDWRKSYTYTEQSSLETVLKENWSAEGNEWENYSLRTINYNDKGNWVEDVTQLWDSTYWLSSLRYLATWDEPVSVNDDKLAVNDFHLFQNFPNPFNPVTQIRFTISEVRFTTLKVFDVLGNEVFTLVNEEKPAGRYEVEFNAIGLPSGVYFYQLKAVDPSTGSGQSFIETKKMILLR